MHPHAAFDQRSDISNFLALTVGASTGEVGTNYIMSATGWYLVVLVNSGAFGSYDLSIYITKNRKGNHNTCLS